MAKPFDVTTKHLTEAYPADWLKFAGLPLGKSIRVIDADLSSVSRAADKVIRVEGPDPYIAHVEVESSAHPDRDRQVLMYSAILGARHELPVRSVMVLLRREAHSPAAVGSVKELSGTPFVKNFGYKVIRLWEVPPELLLAGGPGTLPLVPLSDVPRERVGKVVRQMEQRLYESAPAHATELETAAYILMGLRYPVAFVEQILKGARQMKESVTYQAILKVGRAEGMAEGMVKGMAVGERNILIRLATKKFGRPSARIQARLRSITDEDTLVAMIERINAAAKWEELFV